MTESPAPPADLARATLDAAYRVIAAEGLDALSLRAVARDLGVSHQAPYRHFPSRDHLLAALVTRIYEEFGAVLAAVPESGDAFADLAEMGRRYLDYALDNPLKYRLMFNTPLPDRAAHPQMMAAAGRAWELLAARLAALPLRPGRAGAEVRGDAVFIWSALHGLASLMMTDAGGAAALSPADRDVMTARVLARISDAIHPDGQAPCGA